MRALFIIALRMRCVVVAFSAVLPMVVVLAASGIVMPECHALPRGDSGHALRGDG